MTKGWECCKCERVFSPLVDECKYCVKEKTVLVENGTPTMTVPHCRHGISGECPHCEAFKKLTLADLNCNHMFNADNECLSCGAQSIRLPCY